MPRIPWMLLLLFLLAGPARAETPEPRNVEELSAALDAVTERLAELKKLAARDERWRTLEQYAAKGPEELRKRRGVRAEDVFEVMIGEGASIELRDAARARLLDVNAVANDPDLVDRDHPRLSRKHFARRTIVEHLRHKDPTVRRYVHELLLALFPAARRDIDLRSFDPEKATRREQKSAESDWTAFLRSL